MFTVAQIFLADLPDGWVKRGCDFKADVVAKDQGKTNKDGKHEFHGCFRDSKHLAKDVRTAIALQLWQVMEVEGHKADLVRNFEPVNEYADGDSGGVITARPWMDMYLIPGFTRARKRDVFRSASSATQRSHFSAAAKAAGIHLKKGQSTHARRHRALKTFTRHASRQAKARYGGWSEGLGRMERHYEDPLEWGVMATASGHSNKAVNILRDRFVCMDLVQAVSDAGLRHLFLALALVLALTLTLPGASPDVSRRLQTSSPWPPA